MKNRRWDLRLLFKKNQAQAMVEAALAIPILILLFAGCLQLVHVAIANAVVQVAAYEAGRQAGLDSSDMTRAQAVAQEICGALSKGSTNCFYDPDSGSYKVTHNLKAIVPVLGEIKITHACPAFLF